MVEDSYYSNLIQLIFEWAGMDELLGKYYNFKVDYWETKKIWVLSSTMKIRCVLLTLEVGLENCIGILKCKLLFSRNMKRGTFFAGELVYPAIGMAIDCIINGVIEEYSCVIMQEVENHLNIAQEANEILNQHTYEVQGRNRLSANKLI